MPKFGGPQERSEIRRPGSEIEITNSNRESDQFQMVVPDPKRVGSHRGEWMRRDDAIALIDLVDNYKQRSAGRRGSRHFNIGRWML